MEAANRNADNGANDQPGHPNDPLLGAILLSDDEMAVMLSVSPGARHTAVVDIETSVERRQQITHELAKRGILSGEAPAAARIESPYLELFQVLDAPDLTVVANIYGTMVRERRSFFVRGEAGLQVGRHPEEQLFLAAFDRVQLAENLLRFLGLRPWTAPRRRQRWRVTALDERSEDSGDSREPGSGQETILDLALELGSYRFVAVRAGKGGDAGQTRLGWIDGGNGSLWLLNPPPDPGAFARSPDESTFQIEPVTGESLVDQLVDALRIL